MKLSIIIPMYKVEQYIEKCLMSCVKQDFSHDQYEIICVNDGSPDKSLEIATRIAEQYDNIFVFSKPNGGLSSARNFGISKAKGEYLWFVDSDDWIEENCLSLINNKLDNEKPDILAICVSDVINGNPRRRFSYNDETPIEGKVALRRGLSVRAQDSIVNKRFWDENNLFFCDGILHEDSELTPRMHYLANKISFYNNVVYFVYQNPNSITRSVNPKKSFDLIDYVCEHLSEFSSQYVRKEDQYIFNNMISMYFNNALANILKSSKEEREKLNDDIYDKQNLFVHLKNSTQLKYRIEYCLLKLFPRRAVEIYRVLKMKFRAID